MTNEEKAREISEKPAQYETDFNQETTIRLQRYNAAMLMANWKEQKIFIKVKDYIYKSLHSGLIDCTNIDLFLDGIKQAMND